MLLRGGAEEDPSKTPSQQDPRKENTSANSNRFGAMNDEDAGDEDGWKQAPANGKKWSSIVNGASSPNANSPKGQAGEGQHQGQQGRVPAVLRAYVIAHAIRDDSFIRSFILHGAGGGGPKKGNGWEK